VYEDDPIWNEMSRPRRRTPYTADREPPTSRSMKSA